MEAGFIFPYGIPTPGTIVLLHLALQVRLLYSAAFSYQCACKLATFATKRRIIQSFYFKSDKNFLVFWNILSEELKLDS